MEYSFEVIFKLEGAAENLEEFSNRLYENGCDDSLVSAGNGRIALQFIREAYTLEDAMSSAIRDVSRALPEAFFLEARSH